MIRKTRIKFVASTMIILLVVFWIIGTVSFWLLTNRHKIETNNFLNSTVDEYIIKGNQLNIRPKTIIISSIDGNITDIIYDVNTFDEATVLKHYNNALDSDINKSRFDNIFYKLTEENNQTIFVAVDRSSELSWVNHSFRITITILFFSYLLLFIIVWVLSYPMIEPVRQAFEKQATFVSDAGHELKTPLSIISSSADVLLASNIDDEYLNNIKEQSRRMNFLINDLLSLAKLEEKKYNSEIKEIDVSNLINNIVLSFDSIAFEKDKFIDTDIEQNIIMRVDEHAIKQILQILLDNALKYATENSTILCYLGKINGKITVGVYNQCETVEKVMENKIFERFYRTDLSRNRDTGGNGLGLAIAKKVADLNGWKLYAEIEDKKSIAICLQLN